MSDFDTLLHSCLYFTANALSRTVTQIAEEEFAITGLSPSYAFLLMMVCDQPGVMQKDLSENLELAPSTVTRFVNKLERRGYLERRTEGRIAQVYPTERGLALRKTIEAAWYAFYERYSGLLGEEFSQQLSQMMDEANQTLCSPP